MGSFRGPVGAISLPCRFMLWDPTFMFWSRSVDILVVVVGQELDLVVVKESHRPSDMFSRDFISRSRDLF